MEKNEDRKQERKGESENARNMKNEGKKIEVEEEGEERKKKKKKEEK